MFLTAKVVADSKVAYETTAEIDGPRLLVMAEGRAEMVRSRGPEWLAGAVQSFAQEFVEAAEQQYQESEVGMLATNLAMTAWLNDSIYGGVTADEFLDSDLIFTIAAEGAVGYARLPRSRSE